MSTIECTIFKNPIGKYGSLAKKQREDLSLHRRTNVQISPLNYFLALKVSVPLTVKVVTVPNVNRKRESFRSLYPSFISAVCFRYIKFFPLQVDYSVEAQMCRTPSRRACQQKWKVSNCPQTTLNRIAPWRTKTTRFWRKRRQTVEKLALRTCRRRTLSVLPTVAAKRRRRAFRELLSNQRSLKRWGQRSTPVRSQRDRRGSESRAKLDYQCGSSRCGFQNRRSKEKRMLQLQQRLMGRCHAFYTYPAWQDRNQETEQGSDFYFSHISEQPVAGEGRRTAANTRASKFTG